MVVRSLGKALLGKSTASEVFLGTILGAMLGFVPGFTAGLQQAPGLVFTLVAMAMVLRADGKAFGLALVLAKALSFVCLPAAVWVGRVLVDGPTAGLFRFAAEAPVLAWFGLDVYAVSGGLALGIATGVMGGAVLWSTIRRVRIAMASLQENSQALERIKGNFFSRTLVRVLFGANLKKIDWKERAESRRKKLPLRLTGAGLTVACGVALWFLAPMLGGPMFRSAAQDGLQSFNGATVDLAGAEVDFGEGRVSLEGVALADPNALDRDLFRARLLQLDIGTSALLERRLVVDDLTSADASTGDRRAKPGESFRRDTPPTPPAKKGGEQTLDDYLAEAEKWKERLNTLASWLERFSPGDGDAPESDPSAESETPATDYLGLMTLASRHGRSTPLVLVRNLVFEGLRSESLGEDRLDIRAKNLSSAPALTSDPFELHVKARSGKFEFFFRGSGKEGAPQTRFVWRGLALDDVASAVKWNGQPPVRGGTLDVALEGSVAMSRAAGVWLDLPLTMILRGTTLQMEGLGATKIDELRLPFGLRGPLGAPRVSFDGDRLADALIAAGKKELAKQVRGRALRLLDEHVPGVPKDVRDVLEGAKPVGEVVDRKKAELEEAAKREAEIAKKKAEEEARKAAERELRKRLGGKDTAEPKADPKESAEKVIKKGLGGLLGGKK